MNRNVPLTEEERKGMSEKLKLFFSDNEEDWKKLTIEETTYIYEKTIELENSVMVQGLIENIFKIEKSVERMEFMLTELLRRTNTL